MNKKNREKTECFVSFVQYQKGSETAKSVKMEKILIQSRFVQFKL